MKYTKPPITYHEQIKILVKRGLTIKDKPKAIEILNSISYYRLSAYYLPFQNKQDCFNKETQLEDIIDLYEFDRNLRLLLLEAIENVEVTLRTIITYNLAHKYGAFGYTHFKIFSPRFNHSNWMRKLKESINRSHEIFIKHFFNKYNSEKHLPIWMVTEIISIGQLSILLKGMQKSDIQNISHKQYNIDQKLLVSWIHTLVYVRNLCAHHSRIWNRTLSVFPKIPRVSKEWLGVNNKKIFSVFLILKNLITNQDKKKCILSNFKKLLKININLTAMGFPIDWKERLK